MISLLCTRPTRLVGSLLKQQGIYVAPLTNMLILNQPVFVLSPQCCACCREATNVSFIVFSLI